MGIVTNIVLELVLVCRVHLLGGVPGGPSSRTLKVLRWAVGCQLVIVTLITIAASKPVRNPYIRGAFATIQLRFPPQVLDAVRPSQKLRFKRRTRRRVRGGDLCIGERTCWDRIRARSNKRVLGALAASFIIFALFALASRATST